MTSDKKPVRDLISLLSEHGVEHAVISPGSRNAPVSISLLESPKFQTHTVVDERSAAFVALGIAQHTRKPVVICCTSGSASLNYHPAVAEAWFQKVPLIIITADRPEEWVGQEDGQTVFQRGAYGKHVRKEAQLAFSDDPDLDHYNQRLINEVLLASLHPTPAPVHINLPLRENLYGRTGADQWSPATIRQTAPSRQLSSEQTSELLKDLKGKSILMVVGMLPPGTKLDGPLNAVASLPNVLVLTETTSNLCGPDMVSSIDRLIMSMSDDETRLFRPDVLITLGHNIISKKIKALLRANKPGEHWHVDEADELVDTYQSLSRWIQVDPVHFIKSLDDSFRAPEITYGSEFRRIFRRGDERHEAFLASAVWSDMVAFGAITDTLPKNSVVQMGNSSVVRYMQLFPNRPDVMYFGNRGTSGIDGCTSTAVGSAAVNGRLTTLVIGDISFFYDVNGLWNDLDKSRLKIIVINNGGGGIFRIIDGPLASGQLEKAFETPHGRSIKAVADMYKLSYRLATDLKSLKDELRELYNSEGCELLEIQTPTEMNDSVLKAYFRNLS
jgi:2-succinyl-5-enolpyruvyl-6-hydroxy-3-cyclohexene-1-carboxylate synthase